MATGLLLSPATCSAQFGSRQQKSAAGYGSVASEPTGLALQSTFQYGLRQLHGDLPAARLRTAVFPPSILSGKRGLAGAHRGQVTASAEGPRSNSSVVENAEPTAEVMAARQIGGPLVEEDKDSKEEAAFEGIKLPAENNAPSDQKFKWAEAWYPAATLADLDPKIPKAVTILGRPLVIWWDRNTTKWQVFLDQCPHRLAPLSEGRIHESGQLQCSYHGWTFGGDGSCGMIPQAPDDRPKQSRRACAKVVPSVEHQGLLFVWPELAEGAAERAAQVSPPHIPEFDDPSFSYDIGSRDMSYGADTLIENLMDPAHVPFAHHNIMVGVRVQGNRSRATPLDFKVDQIYVSGYRGGSKTGPAEFTAPCLFTFRNVLPPAPSKKGEEPKEPAKERKVSLVFYCVPTTPGYSKLFFAFPSNFLPKVVNMIPVWYKHLGQMTILDSDMYFLHVQERRLEAEGGSGHWSRACYVPTASDSFVSAYRRWQNSFGGKGFDWGRYVEDPRLPPTPPKEQLMDRYKSHVVQCKACRGAKRNFDLLQYALAALSFAIIAGLALVAVTRQTPMSIFVALPLVVLAGALAFASDRLRRFISKSYVFQDYCHALVP